MVICSTCHICLGPSAPPQNINTVVINSTAISVSWYSPPILDQNGNITGYQLMITNQNRTNSSAIVVNVTSVTSYTATMLEEFEVYDFEIAAKTAIGLGLFSDAVSNQTLEDGQCVLYKSDYMIMYIHCVLKVLSNLNNKMHSDLI